MISSNQSILSDLAERKGERDERRKRKMKRKKVSPVIQKNVVKGTRSTKFYVK